MTGTITKKNMNQNETKYENRNNSVIDELNWSIGALNMALIKLLSLLSNNTELLLII